MLFQRPPPTLASLALVTAALLTLCLGRQDALRLAGSTAPLSSVQPRHGALPLRPRLPLAKGPWDDAAVRRRPGALVPMRLAGTVLAPPLAALSLAIAAAAVPLAASLARWFWRPRRQQPLLPECAMLAHSASSVACRPAPLRTLGAKPYSGNYQSNIEGIAVTPDGSVAVTATSDARHVRFWDLRAHNVYRCMHGTPALKWSTAASQALANYVAVGCPFAHQNSGFGENIYWSSAWGANDGSPVQAWYANEVGNYNYAGPLTSQGAFLHFTQVVWRDSLEVACVKCQRASGGGYCTFCMYNPPGNIWDTSYFLANVPVPTRTADQCKGTVRAVNTQALVTAHAAARCPHGAPALGWSNTIAAKLADWALQCPANYTELPGYNYYTSATAPSAPDAVAAWYSEIDGYNWASPAQSPNTGHFAQLVWQSAKDFACAMCQDNSGVYHVLCQYSAARTTVAADLQANVVAANPSLQCPTFRPSPSPRKISSSPIPTGNAKSPSPRPLGTQATRPASRMLLDLPAALPEGGSLSHASTPASALPFVVACVLLIAMSML